MVKAKQFIHKQKWFRYTCWKINNWKSNISYNASWRLDQKTVIS